MSAPYVQPGVLSVADAARLSAWMAAVDRLLVRPGAGGQGAQVGGGTVVRRPADPGGFWAMLTEVGDYLPDEAGGSGSGSGRELPAGCAPAYSWEEWWDDESGCLSRRPGGLRGSFRPEGHLRLELPAFPVNGSEVEAPTIVWLRKGRNSNFYFFRDEALLSGGSGSGPSCLRPADLFRCVDGLAQARGECLAVRSGRVVLVNAAGHVVAG
jgi:hypothetical protein